MEIFKDVDGYNGRYKISNLGNVKSIFTKTIKKEIILKQAPDKDGYLKICLSKNNIKKNFIVHRLVASSFIPAIKGKCQVNHINGIKTDNRVENLEWCTVTENNQHAFRTGLNISPKGIEHYQGKLTNSDILEIRTRKFTTSFFAEKYGISTGTIYDIYHKRTWKHI